MPMNFAYPAASLSLMPLWDTLFSYFSLRPLRLGGSTVFYVTAPQRQRHTPVLSPRVCHYGGASRVTRRPLWRTSRKSVARPVSPAAQFGGNSANRANPSLPLSRLLV